LNYQKDVFNSAALTELLANRIFN